MYQERIKLELYLELLTQVKNGNCDETTLMKCTNFSQGALRLALEPLLFEKLLQCGLLGKTYRSNTTYF